MFGLWLTALFLNQHLSTAILTTHLVAFQSQELNGERLLMNYEQFINQQLNDYGVRIKFGRNALKDLKSYDSQGQRTIIALLIKHGQKGPLLKPIGLGEPLRGELKGFAKIKYKDMNLRIVYRTLENGFILMEVIAIGPRDSSQI